MRIWHIAAAAALVSGIAANEARAQEFDPMAMADSNGDGKLDLPEATNFTMAAWSISDKMDAGKLKPETVSRLFQGGFRGVPVDAEGYVTQGDYFEAIPARFTLHDVNRDGYLGQAELESFLGMPFH